MSAQRNARHLAIARMVLIEDWSYREVALWFGINPIAVQKLVGLAVMEKLDLTMPIDLVKANAPATN